MKLENQVALITGGGAGIGKATAELFAKQGAAIMVCDWDEESAKSSAAAIQAAGGKSDWVKADISVQADAQAAVDKAVNTFGRIDILINNAGITRDSTLLKMEPHQWAQVIAVNLSGVFYCSQAAARYMKEQKYGRIVSASSISGFGNFGQANYAATKAGVVGVTRTMAIELSHYGITVNAVAPGLVKTNMTDSIPDEHRERMVQGIPVKRIGEPYDMARIYLFLAEPDASFITGALIVADGGQTLIH